MLREVAAVAEAGADAPSLAAVQQANKWTIAGFDVIAAEIEKARAEDG
jgi:hypothetical protein